MVVNTLHCISPDFKPKNIFFLPKPLNVSYNGSCTNISLLLSTITLLNRVIFLVHENGGLSFPRFLGKWRIENVLCKRMMCFSIGWTSTTWLFPRVAFEGRHDIHLSTFHLLLPTLSSSKSLVVGINASIDLLESLFFYHVSCFICFHFFFSYPSKCPLLLIQETIWKHVSPLENMF